MNYTRYTLKKYSNVRITLSIFTLLIIFLFGVILPKSTRAVSEGNYLNSFYLNAINNTLSVIKTSSGNEQDKSNENSIKLAALSFFGVNILNPISIIAREIAFLNKEDIAKDPNVNNTDNNVNNTDNEGKNLKTFILNPFKLGDNEVSKNEGTTENSNVIANLYNPKLKQTLNKAKPQVLIYHSHTSEAYKSSDKDKNSTSMDGAKNVTSVGDVIEEELEKNYGIAVIHDKTVNDKGDYYGAYKKSGATLDKYLKEYGDFKLIIDLHRDSVKKSVVTTKLNGEDVARFMFVVTEKNPKYASQKKMVDSMIGISNKLFPSLIRGQTITTYEYGMGFYNQNKSNNAVLIEVGSDSNTIEEAKNTGKYLARIIAEQLYSKSE